MRNFISCIITIMLLLLSLNFFVSCASKSVKVDKPKPVYTPISTKRLNFIHNFLNRDIEVLKANKVCSEVFELK